MTQGNMWEADQQAVTDSLRQVRYQINDILARATSAEIAGLETWGTVRCHQIEAALVTTRLYVKAILDRSTPTQPPEMTHGWQKPASTAPQIQQLRTYITTQLAQRGYGNIEIIPRWV